jgi:hypothetical protein
MSDFHCVDARYYLYAILSLVIWSDDKGAVPDYNKDSYEVAIYTLDFWTQVLRFRDVLHLASNLDKLFDVSLKVLSFRIKLQHWCVHGVCPCPSSFVLLVP